MSEAMPARPTHPLALPLGIVFLVYGLIGLLAITIVVWKDPAFEPKWIPAGLAAFHAGMALLAGQRP